MSLAVAATYPYPNPLPASGSAPGATFQVTGPVNPTAYNSAFAESWDVMHGGGFRAVFDNTERDAIVAGKRKEGMWVYVTSTDTTYRLDADLLTWVEKTFVSVSEVGVVDTVADLSVETLEAVVTLGELTVGDGGGDLYVRDATSILVPDDIINVIACTAGGNYLRVGRPIVKQVSGSGYTVKKFDTAIYATDIIETFVTLPDPLTVPGHAYVVTRLSLAHDVTVISADAGLDPALIGGAANYVLSTLRQSVTVRAVGAGYEIE